MPDEVGSLIEGFHAWQALAGAVIAFSVIPGVALRLGVMLYPKDHLRRRELIAELAVIPRAQKPFWVAEVLVGAMFEGLGARMLMYRQRPRRVRQWRVPTERSAKITLGMAAVSVVISLIASVGNSVHYAQLGDIGMALIPIWVGLIYVSAIIGTRRLRRWRRRAARSAPPLTR